MIGNALAAIGRWGSMLGDPGAPTGPLNPTRELIDEIWSITWPILLVLGALGGIFAIWLGVRLATAQDESKRKDAKQQLIWAIIAVIVIFAMMGIFGVIRLMVPIEYR